MVEPEPNEDERGLFARTYCRREFRANGLDNSVAQCNTSFNKKRGTLRGMHYQAAPRAEAKLVRCTMGSAYDVVVDLRPRSGTYCKWEAVEISSANRRMVFVPKGLAHGFQTLEDGTELFYQMSQFYEPALARGVRWNDPAFGIVWPIGKPLLSPKDASYGDFRP